MLITPEGRFIPVNMDRCQDLMGGLFEHVTPGLCMNILHTYGQFFLHLRMSRMLPPELHCYLYI